MPHFAVNGPYVTGFYLVNTLSASAHFTISFYDDNGQPIPLPIAGTAGAANDISGSLPPNGSSYYEVGDPSLPLVGGSVRVSAETSIVIQELLRLNLQTNGNNNYYETAVPSTVGGKEFEIPFDATIFAPTGEQTYTAVAIANFDPANTSTVSCIARDSVGNPIPTAVLVPILQPKGHWSEFNFPALLGKRGTLDCSSTTTTGAIAIHAFATSGTISSLPVILK